MTELEAIYKWLDEFANGQEMIDKPDGKYRVSTVVSGKVIEGEGDSIAEAIRKFYEAQAQEKAGE